MNRNGKKKTLKRDGIQLKQWTISQTQKHVCERPLYLSMLGLGRFLIARMITRASYLFNYPYSVKTNHCCYLPLYRFECLQDRTSEM